MFYLELFRALDQEGVRYLVVGGVAVNLHGAERMTMDVDLICVAIAAARTGGAVYRYPREASRIV